MSDDVNDYEMGTLQVSVGKERDGKTVFNLIVDRAAVNDSGKLYLIGVVGALNSIAALRACLNSDVHADFDPNKVRCGDGKRSGFVNKFYREDEHGYSAQAAHLGHGHYHAIFLSRSPGFLPVMSEEALYLDLKKPHYTTPILRSWVSHISDKLSDSKKLQPLFCYRCSSALVTATTKDLDSIVTAGIKSESLTFRELNVI